MADAAQTDPAAPVSKAAFDRVYDEEVRGRHFVEDIAYYDEWPVRHPSFIFAATAYDDCSYYALVEDLETDSEVREVTRNWPLRHPTLWLKG